MSYKMVTLRLGIVIFSSIVATASVQPRPARPRLAQPKRSPTIDPQLASRIDDAGPDELVPVWIVFTDKGIRTERDYRSAVESTYAGLSPRAEVKDGGAGRIADGVPLYEIGRAIVEGVKGDVVQRSVGRHDQRLGTQLLGSQGAQ